ncbi:MAG: NIPSNAP family protein [Planctomycetes bacterium]|nr:NIPSNAP family protein [Planctomycetota bacterium]
MDRRGFLALSGMVGLSPLGALAAGAPRGAGRDLYELREYAIDGEDQRKGLLAFLGEALIPALNRIDVGPVGVLLPSDGNTGPIRVAMRHASFRSVVSSTRRLLEDEEFLRKGAPFWDAPASAPAFKRMESSLLLAFEGMPKTETPIRDAGRIVQLRTYESPSVKTGQKKIEMFNTGGEIAIFRKVGLNPVFFGEALIGAKLPNLTYMLIFRGKDEMDAAWKRFRDDPDWKKLRAIPEYADEEILCGITNTVLVPAECSQI